MAAFFFGALSVFDREIDRWAIPASRFEPTPMPSYDQILKPVFESMQPNAQAREAMRGEVNGPLPERFDTPQRWGSEEHTSELQSPCNLVCRLLLENKKTDQCNRPRPSCPPHPQSC